MTAPLFTLVSRWLGLDPHDRLSGLRWSFEGDLHDRKAWFLAACLAITAGCFWYYMRWQPRRRPWAVAPLALCRATVLTTALMIVAEPCLWAEIDQPAPAAVWLLFDGSESMNLRDRISQTAVAPPTRLQLVNDRLRRGDPSWLARLEARFRVESFLMEPRGGLRPIDSLLVSAGGLPRPVDQLASRRQNTSLGAALGELARRATGEPPAGVIVFSDFNSNAGPSSAEAVRKLRVPLYTVGIGPLAVADERPATAASKTEENGMNSVLREENGAHPMLRVLLAEYEPTWEWRYLKDTLLRDPRIGPDGLHTFLRSADLQLREHDRLFLRELPRDRDELLAYDVIILGDLPAATLGTRFCQQVREFVERLGGGLIVLSGPRFMPAQLAGTPLAELLPVALAADSPTSDEPPFPPRLTAAAADVDFMRLAPDREANLRAWDRLAALTWYQPARAVHPETTVLLEHPTATCADGRTPQPLMALRRQGRGEVLYLAFHETWRLRRPAGPRDYRRFWTTAVHRLGARRAAAETPPTAPAADADRPLAAIGLTRNGALQQELARITGGKAYELEEIDNVLQELRPSERWQTTIQIVPLWNNWLVFVAMVGLMLGEWWTRKRMNLP